jgi:nucleotide-binding universal stress UspA family protein
VELAQRTDSELHVVHVGLVPSFLMSDPATRGYNPMLYRTRGYDRRLYEEIEEESRELLRKLSWRVKVAGGTVAGAHLRMGEVDLEIVGLAKKLGADLIVMGCRGRRGIRRAVGGASPMRLSARPLPGPGGTLARGSRGHRASCPPARRRSINAPMKTGRGPPLARVSAARGSGSTARRRSGERLGSLEVIELFT